MFFPHPTTLTQLSWLLHILFLCCHPPPSLYFASVCHLWSLSTSRRVLWKTRCSCSTKRCAVCFHVCLEARLTLPATSVFCHLLTDKKKTSHWKKLTRKICERGGGRESVSTQAAGRSQSCRQPRAISAGSWCFLPGPFDPSMHPHMHNHRSTPRAGEFLYAVLFRFILFLPNS